VEPSASVAVAGHAELAVVGRRRDRCRPGAGRTRKSLCQPLPWKALANAPQLVGVGGRAGDQAAGAGDQGLALLSVTKDLREFRPAARCPVSIRSRSTPSAAVPGGVGTALRHAVPAPSSSELVSRSSAPTAREQAGEPPSRKRSTPA